MNIRGQIRSTAAGDVRHNQRFTRQRAPTGDTVTVLKDLKLKGSSTVVKVDTKVRNIQLVDGDHDIDCKIDEIGAMKLKSQFAKKI